MFAAFAAMTVISASLPTAELSPVTVVAAPAPAPWIKPLRPMTDFTPTRDGLGFGLSLDITPRAGAGAFGRPGRTDGAFAGSPVGNFLSDRLQSLGVQTQRPYGGAGRWYVYVAMRNQTFDAKPQWGRSDPWMSGGAAAAPALLSDGKLGFGWSRGAMNATLGYAQRQVRAVNGPVGAFNGVNESVAALSLTFRPH